MQPDFGVDAHFYNLAQADKKRVGWLESPEEQLNSIKSMEKIDPNTDIEYTLSDLDQLPLFIRLMKQSWRSGNLQMLSESDYITGMKSEFPDIYNTILTNRNRAWMLILPALNDDEAREFVLVGALHLEGKEGLLNQLKLRGFKVEHL